MRLTEIPAQFKPQTPNLRTSSGLGIVTARSAHATASAVVRRSRHLLAVESGVRNVGEDAPQFVVSTRGSKIIAGRDAEPRAVAALHRHAEAHARAQRETWNGRRAA